MKNHKIYYGWYIVGACFVVSAMGIGLLMNSLGTFIKPVSESLGFERGQFSISVSLSSFMSMLCYPLWGRIIEKYSVRKIMFISSILISLFLLLLSLSDKLWQFYILSMCIGCCNGAVSTLAISTLINRWFVYRKGFALGLATSGSGLGSMIIIPLISEIILKYSWNFAYCILALIFLSLMLSSIVFIIRNNPENVGQHAYSFEGMTDKQNNSDSKKIGITVEEMRKTKCFKYYTLTVLSIGILYGGVVNHLFAYFTDIGYEGAQASTFVSVHMGFLLCGKFLLGIIFDKYGIIIGSLIPISSYFIALICLIFAEVREIAFIYSIFGGLGVSITTVGISYITGNFFGNKDYSKNLGIMMSGNLLGVTVGTIISGLIYDYTKNYKIVWILYIIICIFSMITFLMAVKENRV